MVKIKRKIILFLDAVYTFEELGMYETKKILNKIVGKRNRECGYFDFDFCQDITWVFKNTKDAEKAASKLQKCKYITHISINTGQQ